MWTLAPRAPAPHGVVIKWSKSACHPRNTGRVTFAGNETEARVRGLVLGRGGDGKGADLADGKDGATLLTRTPTLGVRRHLAFLAQLARGSGREKLKAGAEDVEGGAAVFFGLERTTLRHWSRIRRNERYPRKRCALEEARARLSARGRYIL